MKKIAFILCLSVGLLLAACDDDSSSDSQTTNLSPEATVPEDQTRAALEAKVMIKDAFSLLVVERGFGAALALVKDHNERIDQFALQGAPKIDPINIVGKGELHLGKGSSTFYFPVTRDELYLTSQQPDTILMDEDKSGVITPSLVFSQPSSDQNSGYQHTIPAIKTIAVSPTGRVYFHFNEPYIFKAFKDNQDPWKRENGFQCQIFSSDKKKDELVGVTEEGSDALKCIDNAHFISSWQAERESVFQFDSTGNAYYRAEIPNSGKQLVYKLLEGKSYLDLETDPNAIKEVINANICVDNFLVTSAGGVFYTGHTCQSEGSGEGGYFRYISAENKMTEIARDWWHFIYDIRQEEGQVDTAVFFGPDPLSSSTASWDSACLFNFNPVGETPSDRISSVITCGGDLWNWLHMRRSVDVTDFGRGFHNWDGSGDANPTTAWRVEAKKRCESVDQIFAGGGSQISSIKQDSQGDTFVIGNIRKKREGKSTCNIEIRGPHCVIDNNPTLKVIDSEGTETQLTKSSCQTNKGTWVEPGSCSHGSSYSFGACTGVGNTWADSSCTNGDTSYSEFNSEAKCLNTDNSRIWSGDNKYYNNISSRICSQEETGNRDIMWKWEDKSNRFSNTDNGTTSSAASAFTPRFIIRNLHCQVVQAATSGDQWTDELKALAKVDKATQNLVPLSSANEKAIKVWVVEGKLYYASFDSTQGQYLLKNITFTRQCYDQSITTEEACTTAEGTWATDKCLDGTLTDKTTCEGASKTWEDTKSYKTLLTDFEAYTVSKSSTTGQVMVSGLDFKDNSYKSGTVDISAEEPAINLKTELTGIIKSVLVLE